MIKRIGTEARKDLEAFFGVQGLPRPAREGEAEWRDNERVLDDLGVPRTETKPRRPQGRKRARRSSS